MNLTLRGRRAEANIAPAANNPTTIHDQLSVQPLGWHRSPAPISVTAMSVTVTIERMAATMVRVLTC